MTTKIDELPGYNEVSVSERSSTFASASEDSLGLALVSKASGAVICKCDGTAGQVLRCLRTVSAPEDPDMHEVNDAAKLMSNAVLDCAAFATARISKLLE